MPFSDVLQNQRLRDLEPLAILPVADAGASHHDPSFEAALRDAPQALASYGLEPLAFALWPIHGSDRCFIHPFDPKMKPNLAYRVAAALDTMRRSACDAALAEPSESLGAPSLALAAGAPRRGVAAACLAATATDPSADLDTVRAALLSAMPALRAMVSQLVIAEPKSALLPEQARPTTAESECLAELCLGLRPAQIAKRLNKSKRTVENQIRNAQKRLGARTRDEAVAIFLSLGLSVL